MGLSRYLSKLGALLNSSGQVQTAGIADLGITPAKLANAGAELGLSNPILNGDMRVNQRGASSVSYASTVTNFPVDRVRVDAYTSAFGTTGAGTAQQMLLATPLVTPGATFTNALRITPNSNWAKTYVYQNVEDVTTFNGQTVTVSFYARAAANWTIPGQGRITQGFGTGGSADTEHFDNSLIGKVITTSWQRFNYTVTLTSTSGKTIGANNLLGVNIIQGADTSGVSWIEFTGFKLEIGSTATPFVQRPLTLEESLCKRYWQANPRAIVFGISSNMVCYNHVCPVTMRTVPALSLTTTAPYIENGPWSSIGSLTSATVSNGHMTPLGGDISISGTFGASPAGSFWEFGGGQIILSADL